MCPEAEGAMCWRDRRGQTGASAEPWQRPLWPSHCTARSIPAPSILSWVFSDDWPQFLGEENPKTWISRANFFCWSCRSLNRTITSPNRWWRMLFSVPFSIWGLTDVPLMGFSSGKVHYLQLLIQVSLILGYQFCVTSWLPITMLLSGCGCSDQPFEVKPRCG